MLEILNHEQGSEDWLAARCGVVTASCFSQVLAKGAGKTRRSYMLRLAGERITGTPAETYTNDHMERGKAHEAIAREAYVEQLGVEIVECGFMRDGNIGYSPDGIIGDLGLIEIKSKLAHLQAEILLADEVPSEHVAQIQGGMLVSGRQYLDFISYCPGMPLFIKHVERDEKFIGQLKEELERFETELCEVVTKLKEKF